MIYQLPCGRVLFLSSEEYFALTDEEILALVNSGYGEDISPQLFFGEQIPDCCFKLDIDFSPEQDDSVAPDPNRLPFLPESGDLY